MKTLSIQQPWASLIVAGIKDVENRTWDTQYRGRLLIHASSKKVSGKFIESIPGEWANEILNAIWMGVLPDLSDMPTSAIIGYVDLTDCATGLAESLWDGGKDCVKFMLKNACLFDEPITGVNGKLHLWEYDLDENNLPAAHKADRPVFTLDGTHLTMQLEKNFFNDCLNNGKRFSLMPTELFDTTLIDEESGTTKDVRTLTIQTGSDTHTYTLPNGIQVNTILDDAGNPVMIPSLYASSPEVEFQVYAFNLGEELT